MRYLNLIPIALAAAVSGVLSRDTVAQTGTAAPPQPIGSPLAPGTFPYRDAVNAGTVSIITAPAGGAKSVFAADMARVLDEKDKLRILPVLGKGPVQNVIDILYLKSIDMGRVTTDVPEFYKIEHNVAITDRLRYIMKLYNDEIYIIAPTEIKTVFDLEGKRIEAPKDVGLYSAKAIFSRLKINATFAPTGVRSISQPWCFGPLWPARCPRLPSSTGISSLACRSADIAARVEQARLKSANDNTFGASAARSMALTASAETISTCWPAASTTFGMRVSMSAEFGSCPFDVAFEICVGALALALKAFTLLSGSNARLASFTPWVIWRIVCWL